MKDITDTVVIATHDMQLVCEWAQRIVVLLGGKVVADGPRDEIFGNRALLKEVGIRPPEIFSMGQVLGGAGAVLHRGGIYTLLWGGRMMEMETKTKKKLSENILEKFSMDFLRNQVLKNAYGNNDTVIAKLDPRILIAWYLFFGLVPWFVNDLWFLMACFLLVVVTTKLARVAGLVLLVVRCGGVLPDGLSAAGVPALWGQRLHHRAAAGAQPEGGPPALWPR